MGFPSSPLGSHRRTGPPRSQSSSKWGIFLRSANALTSLRTSMPQSFCLPSQNGQPVSGLKCHWTVSRTCASSFSCAARALDSIEVLMFFAGSELNHEDTKGTKRYLGTAAGPARPAFTQNRVCLRPVNRCGCLAARFVFFVSSWFDSVFLLARRLLLRRLALRAVRDRDQAVLGHDVERVVGEDG